MKRIDEATYLYDSTGGKEEMPEKAAEMLSNMEKMTSPPMKYLDSLFTTLMKKPAHSVTIMMDDDGKVLWMASTAPSLRPVLTAVQDAAKRFEEAWEKEKN